MKRLNPYAAPPSAHDLREAPYARFVSCGYLATIAGACFVLLVLWATRSGLWCAAAAFLSLELHFLQAGIIAWLTETLSWPEREAMDHRKMAMPQPRHPVVNHYSNAGFTIAQVMWCISAIIGAHALLIVLHFIAFAVFGMDQPRW